MTDYASDASAVQGATDRLLTAVQALDEDDVAKPSLLPGWSRGHVLAHLARNADAMVNLLTWARTGEERRMYPSDEARDGDIERDAHRPLAVHLDDLRTSAYRFNSAAAALPRDRWSFEVATRGTGTERAERLPFHRLCEVELHHVDLGIGYTVADLPDAFVVAQVDALASGRFAGHPVLPALLLSAGVGGLRWRTGATGADPVTVTGSPAALLGWLTGRTDGSELSCPGASLPVLPPLG